MTPKILVADRIESVPAESVAPASVAEQKLANIILAARRIAVLAEEVMREHVTTGANTNRQSLLHSSPELAVRLLTATEEQLNSVLALSQQGTE